MGHFDFFIAGRWRNKDEILAVLEAVRDSGKSAYCFLESDYKDSAVAFAIDGNPEELMQQFEELPLSHPFVRQIFDTDIEAEKKAENFLLVLPAGNAGHIEAGVAYGLGKKCYAVGPVEKTDSLYCIFDEIFADLESLKSWLD